MVVGSGSGSTSVVAFGFGLLLRLAVVEGEGLPSVEVRPPWQFTLLLEPWMLHVPFALLSCWENGGSSGDPEHPQIVAASRRDRDARLVATAVSRSSSGRR